MSYGIAERALLGVGDASLGEWVERARPNGVVHIRRRLSRHEHAIIGDAVDIRGTSEERTRKLALLRDAPYLANFLSLS